MKKILLICIAVLLFTSPSIAATWFGCAAQEITAANTFKNDAACTGAALTWASLANSDILVANGYTISIANDVGSGAVQVTLTTEGTDYGGADGGGYTFAVNAVTAKTLYTHIVAGSTDCLTITGAGAAGTELAIIGNITGGTSSNAEGVNDTHSGVGAAVVVTGNITGGNCAATSCYGYTFAMNTNASTVSITGNATPSTAAAINNNGSAGTITLTGNCIGSDSAIVEGCQSQGVAAITVVGNISSGNRSLGMRGSIIWTPTAPANGVTGHYVMFDGGGTPVYAGTNTNDATKALTTFYYIDPTDGTSDQGSATTGGGGGAWLF